jgi:WD40 repeat protein
VHDAVNAAITTGIGQHLPGSGGGESCGPSWRPRGVLASHLHEHRAAVNCLATSNNGALLISGSDDETVKVGKGGRVSVCASVCAAGACVLA